MDLKDFGKTIKNRRKERRVSQQVLADMAGVDRSLLSRLENEKLAELGVSKLEGICRSLGLELSLKVASTMPTMDELSREFHEP